MSFSSIEKRKVYNRTFRKCHICGKKLSFTNYGYFGLKGAWEVEHSNPRSLGGTNRLNNLYAACITCNRSKNNNSTRLARTKFGSTKAPLSKEKYQKKKRTNAILIGIIGGMAGSFFGSLGAGIGATFGAKLGYKIDPDDN